MTLRQTFEEAEHGLVGMSYILKRKYYDDRWNGERDGYLEIEVKDYVEFADDSNSLIKVLIKSAFQGHRPGDIEWHDMNWCAQWEIVTRISQFPI